MIKSFKAPLVICTIIVAACSILYELLLAQTLSTTMGNTVLRYNITVGLYMASLGVGALIYSKLNIKDHNAKLIDVEIILSLVGGSFPILILVAEFISRKLTAQFSLNYSFVSTMISGYNHLLIIIIGLLSGFELPLLMEIGKKLESKLDIKILVSDYFGTLLGIVFFPNFLLPKLGLFAISFLISFLNSLVALYLVFRFDGPKHKKIITCALILVSFTALVFHNSLTEVIIKGLYLND